VQEPTPNNHINLYVDATGTPCRAMNEQVLRCDMVPASPVLTSLDAAIFFLRMIGGGADSMDKGVPLPTKPTKTTYYIGGLYEVDSDGATRSYYIMGGQGLAMRLQNGGSQSVVYLNGDHLGSVSMATDSSGNRVSKQDFDPWGKVRSSSKVDQTTRSYTGQQLDGTGLLYYHARYYDPGLARFISADSIVQEAASNLKVDFHETAMLYGLNGQNHVALSSGLPFQTREGESTNGTVDPQALNRYSYVLNNPLNFADPSGHKTVVSYLITGKMASSYAGGTGDQVDRASGKYQEAANNQAAAVAIIIGAFGAAIGAWVGVELAAGAEAAGAEAADVSGAAAVGAGGGAAIGGGVGYALGKAYSSLSSEQQSQVKRFGVWLGSVTTMALTYGGKLGSVLFIVIDNKVVGQVYDTNGDLLYSDNFLQGQSLTSDVYEAILDAGMRFANDHWGRDQGSVIKSLNGQRCSSIQKC